MRRITMAFMATVAVVVLLFSYRTSTSGPRTGSSVVAGAAPEGVVPDDSDVPDTTAPDTTVPDTTAPDTAAPKPSATSGTKAGGNVTVNGRAVMTRWGPVQVQVKIRSGRITDVVVLQRPTGERRDEEINSYALPILHDEVIAAQSATIDNVSGATVTTDGYVRSLQAALDAANFAS
jgi:uncharacterized protein with FMN-binding domain